MPKSLDQAPPTTVDGASAVNCDLDVNNLSDIWKIHAANLKIGKFAKELLNALYHTLVHLQLEWPVFLPPKRNFLEACYIVLMTLFSNNTGLGEFYTNCVHRNHMQDIVDARETAFQLLNDFSFTPRSCFASGA